MNTDISAVLHTLIGRLDACSCKELLSEYAGYRAFSKRWVSLCSTILLADKGYDYEDAHQVVAQEQYVSHIKHRRRRNEPVVEECPIPGELRYPARRWVVERTLGWLCKRRSLKIRWCKKPENWLAFIQLACAHILLILAIYG